MKLYSIFLVLVAAQTSMAANLPANHCEIFIKDVMAGPSSHGAEEMMAEVKVKYFGNGETVKRVGFYENATSVDLGNLPGCGSPGQPQGWNIVDGAPGSDVGLSRFNFTVASGSVSTPCSGFQYSFKGSFFVETNLNTYWLNPNMDTNQYFYFDMNGMKNVMAKGTWQAISTNRSDMSYYNPLKCE